MFGGQKRNRHGAQRMPEQSRPVQLQAEQKSMQIFAVTFGIVPSWRCVGLTVAARVIDDNVIFVP